MPVYRRVARTTYASQSRQIADDLGILPPMSDEDLKRWQELCRLAADENDPVNLVKLAGEFNLLLAKKLDYLAANPPKNPKT